MEEGQACQFSPRFIVSDTGGSGAPLPNAQDGVGGL